MHFTRRTLRTPFLGVETSPTVRKMRPFTGFWRKLCVRSQLLEIFRHLNAISISFHAPNTMYANFIVERSRCVRKIRPFPRSWRKLRVISLLLEIFRRLIAISTAFYMSNATHAIFSVERSPTMRKMRPFTRFWRKLCVISLLSEIFRRLNAISIVFYTPNASHVVFRRRNKPNCAKNATNLLDFDENCALNRSCWRYFDV